MLDNTNSKIENLLVQGGVIPPQPGVTEDDPHPSKEGMKDVMALFGHLSPGAKIPFVSHNADRLISTPVPNQELYAYEVFLGSYVRAMTIEHTRRERTFVLPLTSNGSGAGVITYFDDDYTSLPSGFKSNDHMGSLEYGDYEGGKHSAAVAVPFIDIRLGDSLVDDIANSIVTVRVQGSLLSDDPAKRAAALTSHSFDTGSIIFVPSEADFKVRIYPYALKGSAPYYVPFELVTGEITDIHASSLEVAVTGVTGLVSVTIPTVHGQTLQEFGSAVEAALTY